MLFLGITLYYTKNIIQSHRYLKSHLSLPSGEIHNRVTLLVPLYQETAIIGATVEYFADLATRLSVPVIFITTSREGEPNNNDTYQAAQKLVSERPLMSILHCSKTQGSKAAQLNSAMKRYHAHTDYFGIFDADSRPDFRGIEYVQRTADPTIVLQMPSIYLPHSTNSLASQALAAFQTRWSYCFEIPHWRRWQQQSTRPHAMYLVGHGLFIHNDLHFSENTISEDLELGYRLSAKAASFKLIPYFDKATTPQSFTTATIQASRWYYGEFMAPLIFARYLKESKHAVGYGYRCLIRYSQIVLWMLGPILLFSALIATLTQPLVVLMGIAIITMYCAQPGFICGYGHASYRSLLLIPIRVTINGFGPIMCLGCILLDKLRIRELQFVKTKR